MNDVKPGIVADILLLNAADYYRGEIADEINQIHGTDFSDRDVSEVINSVEEEFSDTTDTRQVIIKHISVGYGSRLGEEFGGELSTIYQQILGDS